MSRVLTTTTAAIIVMLGIAASAPALAANYHDYHPWPFRITPSSQTIAGHAPVLPAYYYAHTRWTLSPRRERTRRERKRANSQRRQLTAFRNLVSFAGRQVHSANALDMVVMVGV